MSYTEGQYISQMKTITNGQTIIYKTLHSKLKMGGGGGGAVFRKV